MSYIITVVNCNFKDNQKKKKKCCQILTSVLCCSSVVDLAKSEISKRNNSSQALLSDFIHARCDPSKIVMEVFCH